MNRLTDEQYQKAVNLAQWVDCSPHEWPRAADEIKLICFALQDAHQDKARLTKLIRLSTGGGGLLSDSAWDLATAYEIPEEHRDDPQYLIREVIDREIEPTAIIALVAEADGVPR